MEFGAVLSDSRWIYLPEAVDRNGNMNEHPYDRLNLQRRSHPFQPSI